MDISTHVHNQIEEVGYQLERVIAGIEGDQWDAKLCDDGMSPRETVAHLADCYSAVQVVGNGEEYAWGSYVVPEDPDEAVLDMLRQRAAATKCVLGMDPDKMATTATAYIVLHDAYHVGQLAELRLSFGGWEPYSIYRM